MSPRYVDGLRAADGIAGRSAAVEARPDPDRRPLWPYVVGDIHGCWDSYQALEERIQRHAARAGARPLVVSVGDLVDRGPASPAVVAHFRRGSRAGTHRAVLGNHDLLFLETLSVFGPQPIAWPPHLLHVDDLVAAGDRSARWLTAEDYRAYRKALWLTQGGYQTLEAYGCDPLRPQSWQIDPEDLAFLLGLPVLWQDDALVVSHALATPETLALGRLAMGLATGGAESAAGRIARSPERAGPGPNPDSDTDRDATPSLASIKQACDALVWNRRPPERRADPRRLHVSGHTPVGRPRLRKALGYLQIDTACVYGKRLTATCGPTGELFSVPLRDRVLL